VSPGHVGVNPGRSKDRGQAAIMAINHRENITGTRRRLGAPKVCTDFAFTSYHRVGIAGRPMATGNLVIRCR
jgi:hypothetical protein